MQGRGVDVAGDRLFMGTLAIDRVQRQRPTMAARSRDAEAPWGAGDRKAHTGAVGAERAVGGARCSLEPREAHTWRALRRRCPDAAGSRVGLPGRRVEGRLRRAPWIRATAYGGAWPMGYKSRFSAVSCRGAWRSGEPRGSEGRASTHGATAGAKRKPRRSGASSRDVRFPAN